MTRDEWNALVARYTAALVTRVDTHDPALVPARDLAVADALLAIFNAGDQEQRDRWQAEIAEMRAEVAKPRGSLGAGCTIRAVFGGDWCAECTAADVMGCDVRDPGQKP